MSQGHLKAIQAGAVTKSNVIGIRKAIKTEAKQSAGWSVSCTSPKVTHADIAKLGHALDACEPMVSGELHATGLTLLQSKRYRKRLAPVAHIIANLECFRLVAFCKLGKHQVDCVPVYRADAGAHGSFYFRNIPWQSGGSGPEIMVKIGRDWETVKDAVAAAILNRSAACAA